LYLSSKSFLAVQAIHFRSNTPQHFSSDTTNHKNCTLLGRYPTNSGKALPKFRDKLSAPSSRNKIIRTYRFSRNGELSNPSKRVKNLGTDTWSRTVGKELPQHAA